MFWEVWSDTDNYAFVTLDENDGSYRRLLGYSKTPDRTTWPELTGELYFGDDGDLPLGNFTGCIHGFFFCDEAAFNILISAFPSQFEWASINASGSLLFIINPPALDCLDMNKSEFHYAAGITRPIGIKRPVFYENTLNDAGIFRAG